MRAKGVTVANKLSRGKTYEIKARGDNIGNEDASSFIISFYISSNNNISTDGDTLLAQGSLSGIQKNKTKTAKYKWKVPKSFAKGDYFIKVVWDSEDIIIESDETNNIGVSSKIKIK